MELFNVDYYQDLEGGILEAFGRLFRNDLRLYACPALNQDTGELTTVHDLFVDKHLRHLYMHLLESGYIRELVAVDKSQLSIFSHTVLDKIRKGESDWEDMVPDKVAKIIRDKGLFHCRD